MSTLGTTSASTLPNYHAVNGSTTAWYLVGQMPSDGTLSSVSCEGWSVNGDGAGAGNFRLSVATGSSTQPLTKISGAETGDLAYTTTKSIKTQNVSGALTSGDYIWVGVTQNGAADFFVGDTGVANAVNTWTQDTVFPAMTIGGSADISIKDVPVLFITYSNDSTAPSLTAGPTVSNADASGFDIGATADEGGTAMLLVTAVGASQPSDAAFDASTETAAITANTPFTIHHNG